MLKGFLSALVGEFMMVRWKIIQTVAGFIGAAWTDMGLQALTLPCKGLKQAEKELRKKLKRILQEKRQEGPWEAAKEENEGIIIEFTEQVNRYLAGEKVKFSVHVDWSFYTPFQRKVLEVVRLIPYGQTSTYGEIASYIENPRAGRAVGNALSSNRVPLVIPCHRVIRSDGTLGGFAGGLAWKEYLLKLEGVLR